MNEIKFDAGANNVLMCPVCNSENPHHEGVTVFDRAEDAAVIKVTEVSDGRALSRAVPERVAGNPSSRRDALAVRFSCEQCPNISELTIVQHKGSTYLAWRHVGTRSYADAFGPVAAL